MFPHAYPSSSANPTHSRMHSLDSGLGTARANYSPGQPHPLAIMSPSGSPLTPWDTPRNDSSDTSHSAAAVVVYAQTNFNQHRPSSITTTSECTPSTATAATVCSPLFMGAAARASRGLDSGLPPPPQQQPAAQMGLITGRGSARCGASTSVLFESMEVEAASVASYASRRGGGGGSGGSGGRGCASVLGDLWPKSPLRQVILAFCLLNAFLAFLFARMMYAGHVSFVLTAHLRGWDLSQKARSCWLAGLYYILIAAICCSEQLWRTSTRLAFAGRRLLASGWRVGFKWIRRPPRRMSSAFRASDSAPLLSPLRRTSSDVPDRHRSRGGGGGPYQIMRRRPGGGSQQFDEGLSSMISDGSQLTSTRAASPSGQYAQRSAPIL